MPTTLKSAVKSAKSTKTVKKTSTSFSRPKNFTSFRPQIRSRHRTHDDLRTKLPHFKFRSVIRLGSTTDLDDTISMGGSRVEINTTEAIKNSSSKVRMKTCFVKAGVITAPVYRISNVGGNIRIHDIHNDVLEIKAEKLKYPIIAKLVFGSRGHGMQLLQDINELKTFIIRKGTELSSYIFEEYLNYVREYRLHVTENGCFYTCRKMMKTDTPEDMRYFKNDQNCVWIMDTNPAFDKPSNWKNIEAECVKALKSIGLDFGACDVRVQSGKDHKTPKFFIVEINSAPSFGTETLKKYLEMLPTLLNHKHSLK